MPVPLTRRQFLVRSAVAGTVVAGGGLTAALLTGGGTAGAYAWTRSLRTGASGADVRELQIRVAGWAADAPAKTCVRVDGAFGAGTVQENVRRLMYKLEALRTKSGNRSITVNSGFRSVAHNSSVGGASNSMHVYGVAADVVVSGQSTRTTYRVAETCGFSGLESYSHSWQHCDSRVEHPYGSQSWWWESGVVT